MKKYGIVLIPDCYSTKNIVDFHNKSLNIIGKSNKIILREDSLMPHVTLLQLIIREQDIDRVLEEIKLLNCPKINIKKKDISLLEKDGGWIFLNTKNDDISNIHSELFLKVKNFSCKPEVNDSYENYSKKEFFYYKKYGYRYINECFSPHITIGKISSKLSYEKSNKIKSLIDSSMSDLIFDKISLVEVSQYGQIIKSNFNLLCK